MRRVWRAGHLASAALAVACTPAGLDIETPTATPTEAPDLTGEYAAEWSSEGDCDTLTGAPSDIVTGPLTITSTAGDLALDFGEATFDGSIDETFTFTVEGSATVDGWTLALTGEGLAYISGDLWVLEGDLEMNATELSSARLSPVQSNASCAAAGTLTATQLEAGSE